jgi:MOSC domain-containing protein YiiM
VSNAPEGHLQSDLNTNPQPNVASHDATSVHIFQYTTELSPIAGYRRLGLGSHGRYRLDMSQSVVAVSSSPEHTFSKPNRASVTLIAGVGVEGDAHSGELIKHRYLVRRDPTQPNLRQVHLIHHELFIRLAQQGHEVTAGQLGENITTRGIGLLSLPAGAVLQIGSEATIELTGLRNPCVQIDEFQDGLMQLLRYRDSHGNVVRLGGVMAVVLTGGVVKPGDGITVQLPPKPHHPLTYILDSHNPIPSPEHT